MRDVRLDAKGELRCWNCGSKTFREKRTARSKVMLGVGALVTKKKLKCQACGEYNDVGNAQPYTGPANRKLGEKYGTIIDLVGQPVAGNYPPPPPPLKITRSRW
jgi:DNA-directed RNA polymerase subunit RPC12/RpoP